MNGGRNTVTGRVTSINVKGKGANSAQLLFTVVPDGEKPTSLVVLSDAMPQTFSGMTSLLATAMALGMPVKVSYELATPTPKAFEIELRSAAI